MLSLRSPSSRRLRGLDAVDAEKQDYDAAMSASAVPLALPGDEAGAGRGFFGEAALPRINATLDRNPKDKVALMARAHTYQLMGRYSESLADFNTVIELGVDNFILFALRGEVYQALGESEKAMLDYDAALAKQHNDVDVLTVRADLKRSLGDHAGAIADFDQLLAIDPTDHWATAERSMSQTVLETGGTYQVGGSSAEFFSDSTAATSASGADSSGRMPRVMVRK